MKIKEITGYAKWIGNRNQFIVVIETDKGIYGLGEGGFSGRELAVEGALRHLREFLLGKDPRNIGALWQEMYRGAYFEGGRTITAAVSAIDMALWDILGKSLGAPVYQLLGGKHRDKVPCFCTTSAKTTDKLIDEIGILIGKGWNIIRMTPLYDKKDKTEYVSGIGNPPGIFDPSQSLFQTSQAIGDIRDAIGYDFQLGIDYHHRLTPAQTVQFCNRLRPADLDFLEEPTRDQNPDVYRYIRDKVSVPLAIGEEMSNKWDYAPYIENDLTQFIRLDLCNIGGFTEAMKVAAMAELHYMEHMPHNPLGAVCTAASVHFAAAVPLFHSLEYRYTEFDIPNASGSGYFKNEYTAIDGYIPISDRPGLGIELGDKDLAESDSYRFWEPERLIRPDGSYTNW
jgi:galactonate dehydratase